MSPTQRTLRRLAPLALAACGAVSPAPADQPAEPRARPERVTSELVLIEVYATDDRGRAIPALGRDDFVLLVDGIVRPIAAVEFRETPGGVSPAPAPPITEDLSVAPPIPESVRRFVLVFDDGTSDPAGLTAARHAAGRFLETQLGAGDLVALAAYDTSLRVLQDFTADRATLGRVLHDSLKDRRHSGFAAQLRDREAEIARLIQRTGARNPLFFKGRTEPGQSSGSRQQPAGGAAGFCSPFVRDDSCHRLQQAIAFARLYSEDDRSRFRSILGALETLVDSLAGLPGYRALIFMGEGIPGAAAEPYFEPILRLNPDPEIARNLGHFSLTAEIEALTRAAASAGVTIHTIQTGGVAADVEAHQRVTYRRSNTLATLALNTGGLASSTNDILRGLSEAEASSRAYYVLGYVPEGESYGRFHDVRVRVKRKGVHLRWRRGFVRLPPSEAHARAVQSAYLHPEFFSGLHLELLAVAGPTEASARMIDLVLHLPEDRVLFLPENGRPMARLEVGLTALDEEGRAVHRFARALEVTLPVDRLERARASLNLVSRVRFPLSPLQVTAVVSDRSGGLIGASRLDLPRGADAPGRATGLSLYSLSETSAWVDLDTAAPEGSVPGPGIVVGPSVKATFAVGERVVCGFRLDPGDHREGLRLVVLARGEVLRTADIDPAEITARGTVHAALPIAGLAPGEYRLVVQEGGDTAPIERGSATLRLVPARVTGNGTAGTPG